MSNCPVCTAPADKRCAACQSISYCSAEHQKKHWKTHKNSCIAYTIKANETFGRQLVTTREIKKGTVIFKDEPLAVGPKRLSLPVCIKCHRGNLKGDCFCSGCSLPVCHECFDVPYEDTYHKKSECKLFKKAKQKFNDFNRYHPLYESVLPMRCLQIKNESKTAWEKLMTMAHNNDIRRQDDEIWQRNQVNVVDFLRKLVDIDVDEETVHSIIGIIDVNAYEIKLNDIEVCGVYRIGGLMNHSCKPNTIYIINEKNIMIVIAAMDIPKGDMITTSYADIFQGSYQRKKYLKKTKYFDCECNRCSDPTELGSFISAIKCSTCQNYQVPIDNSFKCQSCSAVTEFDLIDFLLMTIKTDISTKPSTIEDYEEILEKYRGDLHENHYLLIPVIQALTKFYGRQKNYTYTELDIKALSRKKELCTKFLSILDKLDVPLGRRRGATMYELYIAEYLLTKKLLDTNEIGKEKYRERLQNVLNELSECRTILSIDKMITDRFFLIDILDDNMRCIVRDMNV